MQVLLSCEDFRKPDGTHAAAAPELGAQGYSSNLQTQPSKECQ